MGGKGLASLTPLTVEVPPSSGPIQGLKGIWVITGGFLKKKTKNNLCLMAGCHLKKKLNPPNAF